LEERIKALVDDASATGIKPRPFKEDAVRFWSYVDTGPVVERVLAQHSGIGWVGKNTCIINEELGSWLFLGVILTSLELQPDLPAPDRCGTCTRCLESCPTNAFIDAYKLDASKCISYLTIEKRGSIPEDLRPDMQNHVFGCDICQDVCPWNNRTNRPAAITDKPEFQPRPALVNPPLEKLATLNGDEFRELFHSSPIKRTKRSGIRRNAVVAMGNSGDPRFLPLLERLQHDEDPVVAEHAGWALGQLRR
jgi:epoxyqueuosine reductase